MKDIQAIVLAGGKGTRLAPLTDTKPKSLVPILGKPITQYVVDHLKSHGITRVAFSVSHMADQIMEYFGDGSKQGMEFSYIIEPEPMGTGGWTQLVDWGDLAENILVLNADNVFWIDVSAFLSLHERVGGAGTIASIELPSAEMSAAELLLTKGERLVGYVDRTESAPYLEANDSVRISSGWYIFHRDKLRDVITEKSPISMETDVWPALVASGEILGCYDAKEPWFDSGTHERIERIKQFLLSNKSR